MALILFTLGYTVLYALGGSPGAIFALALFLIGSALIVRRERSLP